MAVYESIKTRVTVEGGLAVKLVAGEALLKGEIVAVSGTVAGEAVKVAANADNPGGIVYEDADAGDFVWVVYAGLADVLPKDGDSQLILSFHVYVSATIAGRAECSANVNAARHWGEIGHVVIPSASNGALGRCLIHFN